MTLNRHLIVDLTDKLRAQAVATVTRTHLGEPRSNLNQLTEARELLRIVDEQLALIDAAPVKAGLVEATLAQPEPTEEAQVDAPANLSLPAPLPPSTDWSIQQTKSVSGKISENVCGNIFKNDRVLDGILTTPMFRM